MTSYQNISPLQSEQLAHAHIIKSDEEALEIARNLAEQFKINAVQRDAERILPFEEIEAYSQSGLWAITVPKEYWTAPSILDTRRPHFEAASKASGLIPSRCE